MRLIEISPMVAEAGEPGAAPLPSDREGVEGPGFVPGPCQGQARLVACPGVPAIGPDEALWAAGAERVLYRVLPERESFPAARGSLTPEGARTLVRLGVRLFGTDAPPSDPLDRSALEAHRLLHRGGVAYLERLTLAGIPAGEYDLIALPPEGQGVDAVPVRLALRVPDVR